MRAAPQPRSPRSAHAAAFATALRPSDLWSETVSWSSSRVTAMDHGPWMARSARRPVEPGKEKVSTSVHSLSARPCLSLVTGRVLPWRRFFSDFILCHPAVACLDDAPFCRCSLRARVVNRNRFQAVAKGRGLQEWPVGLELRATKTAAAAHGRASDSANLPRSLSAQQGCAGPTIFCKVGD